MWTAAILKIFFFFIFSSVPSSPMLITSCVLYAPFSPSPFSPSLPVSHLIRWMVFLPLLPSAEKKKEKGKPKKGFTLSVRVKYDVRRLFLFVSSSHSICGSIEVESEKEKILRTRVRVRRRQTECWHSRNGTWQKEDLLFFCRHSLIVVIHRPSP